jgi:small-conductance mechanosensitive channel
MVSKDPLGEWHHLSVQYSTIELIKQTESRAPMDQTITSINATEDFLKSEIIKKDARIAQLEEHSAQVTQRSYGEVAERNRMRNEMHEWTLEQLNDSVISEDVAQEIADICGFELTQEFELEVTVQYSITVNARDEEEAQSLIHDIDFDSVSEPQGVTYLSSSIDRIDI